MNISGLSNSEGVALLENSDMKMSEIAYTTGFATANYFTRAFKARYNVSPTDMWRLKKGRGWKHQRQSQQKCRELAVKRVMIPIRTMGSFKW